MDLDNDTTELREAHERVQKFIDQASGLEDPNAPEWQAAREKSREILDPDYARMKYRDSLVDNGMSEDQANRLAEITAPIEGLNDDPATRKAREELRDSYIDSGMNREEACRLSGIHPAAMADNPDGS